MSEVGKWGGLSREELDNLSKSTKRPKVEKEDITISKSIGQPREETIVMETVDMENGGDSENVLLSMEETVIMVTNLAQMFRRDHLFHPLVNIPKRQWSRIKMLPWG
ncbi:CsoR family transcriptional regulator [Sesbania bispinosa]|nr:CsoR family transcriptional regulator [Sesbania bispinosa]